MSMIGKVEAVSFHRNGIGGAPFYTVRFKSTQLLKVGVSRAMLAVVFEIPGMVAVVNLDNPDIRWRGDRFEPDLRAAIAQAWEGEANGDVLDELSPNGEAYR